jgi:glutaredoxin-like protein
MAENMEGQKVPNVTFRVRKNNEWVNVTTDEIFNNKTVIVFSLPGAYTPTCSSAHVPGYNEFAGVFKANGVDEIVCISVNDTFVMNEWQKDQCAENITFLPDGNGEFTEKMGQLVDKSDLGFGKRSWRYSMLVKNGVVDKMFIEADVPGDPFQVSDAETMLQYVNAKADRPKRITLFTKKGCPHCARAKQLLTENQLSYEEIELNKNITSRSLCAVSGALTTPQVFIDGRLVGGTEALEKYLSEQKIAI